MKIQWGERKLFDMKQYMTLYNNYINNHYTMQTYFNWKLTFCASCSYRRSWRHWSSFTFLMCHSCNKCCRVTWIFSSSWTTCGTAFWKSTFPAIPAGPLSRLEYPESQEPPLLPPVAKLNLEKRFSYFRWIYAK